MKDLQKQVKSVSKISGFDSESLPQKFMLLVEEVGEFAKSVRKTVGTKVHKHSKEHDPKGEASDVLYVLLDICNKLKIDLDLEFKKKLKKILTYNELSSEEETQEILKDKKLMRAIRQGEKEIEEGKGIDWEDFKKELKLEN